MEPFFDIFFEDTFSLINIIDSNLIRFKEDVEEICDGADKVFSYADFNEDGKL